MDILVKNARAHLRTRQLHKFCVTKDYTLSSRIRYHCPKSADRFYIAPVFQANLVHEQEYLTAFAGQVICLVVFQICECLRLPGGVRTLIFHST